MGNPAVSPQKTTWKGGLGGKFGNDYGRSPCAEDSPFIPVAASASAAHCMKNTPMLSVLPVQYSDSLVDFCRLMKQSTASSQDPAGTVELCEMHAEAVRIRPQDVTSDTVDLLFDTLLQVITNLERQRQQEQQQRWISRFKKRLRFI